MRPAAITSSGETGEAALSAPLRYLLAVAACGFTTSVATPLHEVFDLANIVMLFLLTVVLVAWWLGRGAAVMSAFLSVALFDFFFVPPRLSFTVADAQYILTFVVMLVVALIIGHLVTGLREQANSIRSEERRTHALYEMARELAGASMLAQVAEIANRFVEGLRLQCAILLPAGDGSLHPIGKKADHHVLIEPRLALMAYDEGEAVEFNALSEADYAAYYFPLKANSGTLGVMTLAPASGDEETVRNNHQLLETLASLIAIAVERLHLVEVAQKTEVAMTAERLRSSVLAALSHDLRTPLTALVGLADSLVMARPSLPPTQRETAEVLRDQALRINGMVNNLLDMARLQAGAIKLKKEWQPLEEVIGASLKLLQRSLDGRSLKVSLAGDLPLLEFDAVLIERVFCNLLENAAKFSPNDSPIEIVAMRTGDFAEISVCDSGTGIAEDKQAGLFELFARGDNESSKPGVGLGLAICRAIVAAHGGRIALTARDGGGTCATFSLPVGNPPVIDSDAYMVEKTTHHG
jgi:two-component system sensor histidine kinase KdpD